MNSILQVKDKVIAKLQNIIEKESKYSNKLSVIFLVLFVVELCIGYAMCNKYYLNYNFTHNVGVTARFFKILPLIIFIVVAYLFSMPKIIDKFYSLYFYFFAVFTSIPLVIVYIFSGLADSKNVLVYIYTIVILVAIGNYAISKIDIKVYQIKLSEKQFWSIIIAFCVLSFLYVIYKLGIPDLKGSISDVYGVRLAYRKLTNRYVDYLVQWLGNIIIPFLFAYLLKKKKNKYLICPILMQMLLYSYTAYRSLLVTLILAPLFALMLSNGLKRFIIEKAIVGAIFIGIIAGCVKKYTIFLQIVLRIFLWPSLIAMEYYDFFWMYPKMYLSHSILGHFISNKYLLEPPFYLASLYYNKPEMRLNTTWYADAYMNFGFLGIISFAVLLFAILVIIKSMEKKDSYLVSSLLFGGIIALFNAPLLTTILTHGLGISLLLAYLLPSTINAKGKI